MRKRNLFMTKITILDTKTYTKYTVEQSCYDGYLRLTETVATPPLYTPIFFDLSVIEYTKRVDETRYIEAI